MPFTIFYLALHVLFGALPTSPTNNSHHYPFTEGSITMTTNYTPPDLGAVARDDLATRRAETPEGSRRKRLPGTPIMDDSDHDQGPNEGNMKSYMFTIVTTGRGGSPEEAWADACDTIRQQLDEFLDPDDLPDYEVDDSFGD
jgi:hypothetical protein